MLLNYSCKNSLISWLTESGSSCWDQWLHSGKCLYQRQAFLLVGLYLAGERGVYAFAPPTHTFGTIAKGREVVKPNNWHTR